MQTAQHALPTSPSGGPPAIFASVEASSAGTRGKIIDLAKRAGAQIARNDAPHHIALVEGRDDIEVEAHLVSSAPVLVLWSGEPPDRARVSRLLRAGVVGLLPLECSPSSLRAALKAISRSLLVLHPAFVGSARPAAPRSGEELTEREQQVLTMLGEGLSNKEIAARMGISRHTVKFHISSVLGKLGAASRTEALSIGVKTGKLAI